MKAIRCLFCDRTTTVHHINAQKRIKGKIVTLTNAPVYYCAHCKETFLSKETQDVSGIYRTGVLTQRGSCSILKIWSSASTRQCFSDDWQQRGTGKCDCGEKDNILYQIWQVS